MSTFLDKIIDNYYQTSTTPQKCISYLKEKYPDKKNNYDHMAFRSLTEERFNDLMQKIQDSGFDRRDFIEIPIKLDTDVRRVAYWFKSESYKVPRIFLSRGFPTSEHKQIFNCQEHGNDIKYGKLKALGNDYILWTWLFETDINHVAVEMSDYDDFEGAINQMATDLNLDMNINDGVLFQVSKDKKLIQCSTKADFYEGTRKNYVEFVNRIDGREGFEGNNAYGIFRSTK